MGEARRWPRARGAAQGRGGGARASRARARRAQGARARRRVAEPGRDDGADAARLGRGRRAGSTQAAHGGRRATPRRKRRRGGQRDSTRRDARRAAALGDPKPRDARASDPDDDEDRGSPTDGRCVEVTWSRRVPTLPGRSPRFARSPPSFIHTTPTTRYAEATTTSLSSRAVRPGPRRARAREHADDVRKTTERVPRGTPRDHPTRSWTREFDSRSSDSRRKLPVRRARIIRAVLATARA